MVRDAHCSQGRERLRQGRANLNPFRRSIRNARPTPWQPTILALVIAVSFVCGVALAFFEHSLKTSATEIPRGSVDGSRVRTFDDGRAGTTGQVCEIDPSERQTLLTAPLRPAKRGSELWATSSFPMGNATVAAFVIRPGMAHQHE